ncbi:branched-chain amino acid ABC transporter substrate-binding protein [Agarivorans sp. MS3-6]|uniref:branched-chain amino acid ABC transporter substrate-binding protein n=1 Tax=Agarivorans sp. TSD2052 TaxID=2937286 RepID=UPI00200D9C41|nr:branched-chain amino acid ABC transporter substrate-binding protein [Agarivorans sp. TSD2052]UPW18229.1 branched-chain amino acid ABC transporter substrate-binding protein [Agarivorans sp. TSD2052]
MTKWKKSASGLAVSLALFGAVSVANAADTIKVAIAGPVTGPVAQYGDMQFAGAGIAVELLNQAGGIEGKQIEAVVYDDACEPKQAVAVANKIINDGVKYVIGHLCSGATQPASDVYEDEGVLMITPASTSPDITSRGYQLTFRTIGLDSDQGPTAARYIIDKVKPERVAVIHDKQQYGEGIATSVKTELETAGVKVVAFEGVTAGDKDFSALISKLNKEKVDFVYYGGYHPELGAILRQSAEKGLKATFMGPEGVGNKDISAIAGEASEGLLVTLPKKYDLDPANKPIVDALVEKGDDPTGPFVWTAYAAMQSIVAGVSAAGDDPEAVAEYLRNNKVDTVMGPLQWDTKGDLKGFDFGVFSWHADGSSSAAK